MASTREHPRSGAAYAYPIRIEIVRWREKPPTGHLLVRGIASLRLVEIDLVLHGVAIVMTPEGAPDVRLPERSVLTLGTQTKKNFRVGEFENDGSRCRFSKVVWGALIARHPELLKAYEGRLAGWSRAPTRRAHERSASLQQTV